MLEIYAEEAPKQCSKILAHSGWLKRVPRAAEPTPYYGFLDYLARPRPQYPLEAISQNEYASPETAGFVFL